MVGVVGKCERQEQRVNGQRELLRMECLQKGRTLRPPHCQLGDEWSPSSNRDKRAQSHQSLTATSSQ